MCCDGQVTVSVIIGTLYRKEDIAYLKRSIESILDQTFSNFELIICDTGSTPDATAYLDSLADPRIRLVRREGCLDLASKLNLCLGVAVGRYIARMDDDDWSHPDRLEKEVSFLEENRDISFVGCNVVLIQNGEKAGKRTLPKRPTVENFYFTQPYIHPTLVFRREALEAVGGYSESRDCLLCEDYDLLLRMYQAGLAGENLQECLLDYTVPLDSRGGRRMGHRINEMKTRYRRFKELGRLPKALPYVLKPIAVGLVPGPLLEILRKRRREHA